MGAFRGRTVIALLMLLPLLGATAPAAAAPRPNIVFILSDDQRWDTIDKKHSVDGRTPVMAKVQSLLVNKGVLFQNHFVTTALCCPSRSSILAGKYAHTTDVLRDKLLEFIAQAPQPFFVEFTPYNPPAPATPAPRHVGSFAGVTPWRPPNYAEPNASDKPAWVRSITWTQADQTGTDAF